MSVPKLCARGALPALVVGLDCDPLRACCSQDAVDLTNRCIKRAKEKGASRNAAVRIAASVLTKAAIDRGSKDNVSVACGVRPCVLLAVLCLLMSCL